MDTSFHHDPIRTLQRHSMRNPSHSEYRPCHVPAGAPARLQGHRPRLSRIRPETWSSHPFGPEPARQILKIATRCHHLQLQMGIPRRQCLQTTAPQMRNANIRPHQQQSDLYPPRRQRIQPSIVSRHKTSGFCRNSSVADLRSSADLVIRVKSHIGVDDESGLVHDEECTTANSADITQAHKLSHSKEDSASGDN